MAQEKAEKVVTHTNKDSDSNIPLKSTSLTSELGEFRNYKTVTTGQE